MKTSKEYQIGIMETDGKTYHCYPIRKYKTKEEAQNAIERKKEEFERINKTNCIGFKILVRTVSEWQEDCIIK